MLLLALYLDFFIHYIPYFQLLFHFSMVLTIYLNEAVIDRALSFHRSCFSSGISLLPYLLATLLADLLFALLSLYVLLFLCFAYSTATPPYVSLALISLPYALASLCFVHVLSFLFVDPFTAYGLS